MHTQSKLALGQPLMVAAGNTAYYMAGLWQKLTREESDGANEAAFAGRKCIEEHPVTDLNENDMSALHGGASCCQQTGNEEHLGVSVRKGNALMCVLEEPMAESTAVGTGKQECTARQG